MMERLPKSQGFLAYLMKRKKWWLIPILLFVALLLSLVMLTADSSVIPFSYKLF